MYFEHEQSAESLGLDLYQYIELIADNMIKTRPQKEVIYRPYLQQPWIRNLPVLSFDRIDLAKKYPEAEDGSFVYVKVGLTSEHRQKILVCVAGNTELIYKNEKIFESKPQMFVSPNVFDSIPIMLEPGINELVIKCIRLNGNFSFYFLTSLEL